MRRAEGDMNDLIRAGRTVKTFELRLSDRAIRQGTFSDIEVPAALLADDTPQEDGSAQDEQQAEGEGRPSYVGFDGGMGLKRRPLPEPSMNEILAGERRFTREQRRRTIADTQLRRDPHVW